MKELQCLLSIRLDDVFVCQETVQLLSLISSLLKDRATSGASSATLGFHLGNAGFYECHALQWTLWRSIGPRSVFSLRGTVGSDCHMDRHGNLSPQGSSCALFGSAPLDQRGVLCKKISTFQSSINIATSLKKPPRTREFNASTENRQHVQVYLKWRNPHL